MAEIEAGGRDLVSPRASKPAKPVRHSQRRFEDEISEITSGNKDHFPLSSGLMSQDDRSLLDLSKGEGEFLSELNQRFVQKEFE